MPFDRNPKVLTDIVAKIIANDVEIAGAMDHYAYAPVDMQSDIAGNPGPLWEVVHDELRKYDNAERDLEERASRFDAKSDSKPEALDPNVGGLSLLFQRLASFYGMGLLIFAVYKLASGEANLPSLLSSPAEWLRPGLFLALEVLFLVLFLITQRMNKGRRDRRRLDHTKVLSDWQTAQQDLDKSLELSARKATLERQQTHISALLEGRIRQEMISAINQRALPSYNTTLAIRRPRGFAEIFDDRFTVQTPARKRLEYLLNNMPGGSIWIAGSRGAGKTTLIKNVCGSKRVVETLHGKPVLGILVSAPVAYQARDFLLYLFSTACQKVIEAKGGSYTPPELMQDLPQACPEPADLRHFRYLPPILARFGVWLIATGLVLALALTSMALGMADGSPAPTRGQPTSADANPAPATSQKQTQQKKPLANAATTAAPPAPLPAATVTPPTAVQKANVTRLLEILKIDPSIFVTWGIVLIVLGCILGELVGLGAQRTFLLGAYSTNPFTASSSRRILERLWAHDRWRDDERVARKRSELGEGLMAEARFWLRSMKFQQSYTSGWSGTLKLPIGLEGGINRAMSLAQNQLSMPEIAYFLSGFLEMASLEYQVIIGIDELDKLASDETARQFVNDIKSVFGLDRCFYLVSVSENAMSSFERRGLPFRDEFDSAFDDLIYVDHLDFEFASKLLERRVVGRPMPFFALSYCLSGGLPRDLIRSFRTVIEISEAEGSDRSLSQICGYVVEAEINAKLRATVTAAKRIALEPYVDGFIECLHRIETSIGLDAQLLTIVSHLLDFERFKRHADDGTTLAASLRIITSLPKAETPEALQVSVDNRSAEEQKLHDLMEEIAIYLKFCVTLREFFGGPFTEQIFISALEGGAIDRLARGRQQFSLDPRITLAAVDAFKRSCATGF